MDASTASTDVTIVVESSWNLGVVMVIVIASGVSVLGAAKCLMMLQDWLKARKLAKLTELLNPVPKVKPELIDEEQLNDESLR